MDARKYNSDSRCRQSLLNYCLPSVKVLSLSYTPTTPARNVFSKYLKVTYSNSCLALSHLYFIIDKLYALEHPEKVAEFDIANAKESSDIPGVWISRAWLKGTSTYTLSTISSLTHDVVQIGVSGNLNSINLAVVRLLEMPLPIEPSGGHIHTASMETFRQMGQNASLSQQKQAQFFVSSSRSGSLSARRRTYAQAVYHMPKTWTR